MAGHFRQSPWVWGLLCLSLGLPVLIMAQSPNVGRATPAPLESAEPPARPATLQPPPGAPRPPAGPSAAEPRDPTTVDPDLRPRLDPLTPPTAGPGLPNITVRGRIVAGRRSAAVLDVGGQYVTVHEGSRLDVASGGGPAQSVVVVQLSERDTVLRLEQQDREIRLP